MRSTLATFTTKFVSVFFAATLALGLVPAAAFATPANATVAANENSAADDPAQDVISTEEQEAPVVDIEAPEGGVETPEIISSEVALEGADGIASTEDSQDQNGIAIPAAMERINEDVALTQPVAQQESTRSYFLAQTLESTKTVPIVSANLPLDKGTSGEVVEPVEGENSESSEDEGGDDSDESDPAPGAIAVASTVVGSFTYLGMTFALEPGGESVALVAVDYDQLPESFVRMQVIVIPEAVTPNGYDYYSVTRIADNAFSPLTKENANQDFKGCEGLFSDEDLLAEADIEPSEVDSFLNPESDTIDIDGDGEADVPANPLKDCVGILAIGIPSSISFIGDDAFAGADTLQYLVASEDNQSYASYDGALYSADLTQLRLIPGGRVGAVRVAPSAADVDPEVFSHCPSVTTLVADPESAISVKLTRTDESLNQRLILHDEETNAGVGVRELFTCVLDFMERSFVNPSTNPTNGHSLLTDARSSFVGLSRFPSDQPGVYFPEGVKGYLRYNDLYWPTPMHDYTGSPVKVTNTDGISYKFAGYEAGFFDSVSVGFDDQLGYFAAHKYIGANTTVYFFTVPAAYNAAVNGSSVILNAGYDITYDGNGATCTDGVTKAANYAYYPELSGMDGWTHAGWYEDQKFSKLSRLQYDNRFDPALDGNITFYAKWTKPVKFYHQDKKEQTVTNATGVKDYGASETNVKITDSTQLPAPSRTDGWTFRGWSINAKETNTADMIESVTTSTSLPAYEYYGRWSKDLEFDSKGGTAVDSIELWSCNEGSHGNLETANEVETPTKLGYIFGGWYYFENCSGSRVDSSTGPTAGKLSRNVIASANKLYAKWIENPYTIVYDGNGATAGTTPSSSHMAGEAKALTPNGFAKAGYRFDGWAESATGSVVYTEHQSVTDLADPGGSMTLYAKWTAYDPDTPTSFGTDIGVYFPDGVKGYLVGPTLGGSGTTYDYSGSAITVRDTDRVDYRFAKFHSGLGAKVETGYSEEYGWYARHQDSNGTSVYFYTKPAAHGAAVNGSSVILYAGYDITYDGNGATCTDGVTKAANYAYYPELSGMDGWTHAGWYEDQKFSKLSRLQYDNRFDPALDGNITFYAKWTKPVKFYHQDKTEQTVTNATGVKDYGASETKVKITDSTQLPAPSRTDGWTFKGWSTNATETNTADMIKSVTTFTSLPAYEYYGRWSKDLEFDSKGGTAVDPVTLWSTSASPYGNQATSDVLGTPTKTGYIFQGWFDNEGYTGTRVDDSTNATAGKLKANEITTATKLYAKWIENPYTIVYDGNGATAGTTPSSSHMAGEAKALTPNGFAKAGYRFDGWAESATGSVVYTEHQSVTDLAAPGGSKILYAKWSANTYTVVLNAEGGKDGTASVRATFDADMPTEEVTMPTKSGFTFAGYYDAEEEGNQYYTAKGKSTRTWNKASDATLYAHWTKDGVKSIELSDPTLPTDSDTIWYWPPNGFVIDDEDSTTTVSKLDKVPNVNDYPFLVDYEFKGYFDGKDDDANKMIDVDGTILVNSQDANTTWYAHWDRVSCAVVLDATYRGTLDVEEGTKRIDKAVFGDPFADSFSGTFVKPERVGYTFKGYYTEPNPEVETGGTYAGTQWIDGTGALLGTWVEPEGLADMRPVTLYAAWELNDCNVTYDLRTPNDTEDVRGTYPANDTWHYGVAIPATLPTPSADTFSRNGYSFQGWYYEGTDDEGNPTKEFVSNPDGTRKFEKWEKDVASVTLKADWKPNKYVLVFDEAYPQLEGEPTVASPKYEKTIKYDQKFNVDDPTYDPYAFAGWRLKSPPSTQVAGSEGVAGAHTTLSTDGALRFTPQGNLASQISPAKIGIEAAWDTPVDAAYHLYYWTPGAENPDIRVVDKTYSYGKTETLGKSTYPAAIDGWNPTAGWVEVKATEAMTGDEAARALIASGGPRKDAPTTSSFGPRESEEKFFVFKWTTVPLSLSFKDAPDDEDDIDYVKPTDVLENLISEDEDVLTWQQACSATKTGDWEHVTSMAYDVNLDKFMLPSVSRKGYDFEGWEQVSPESPEVGDTIDPKTVAAEEDLHKIVLAPVFEESVYTVIFEPGTQGRETKTEMVKYTEGFTFPYPDALKTGYCFSSWEAQDGTTYPPDKSVPVAEQVDGSFALSDLDADGDHEITFTGVWLPAYNVTVPVRVTTMAIDTETGDMMAAGSSIKPALKPTIANEEYEVLSLRTEPILVNGMAPFSGAGEGSVYLSVYADMAEPADEASLLRKTSVRAKGVVSYTDKSNALRTATPLLVKLGDDSVSFAGKGEDEGSISSRYGFRTFTYASPLYIRYGLVFEGVDPKAFDFDATSTKWTLPERDSGNTDTADDKRVGWSSGSAPLAKLCYTVQLVNE